MNTNLNSKDASKQISVLKILRENKKKDNAFPHSQLQKPF